MTEKDHLDYLSHEISQFFRQFALQVLDKKQVNVHDRRAFKEAMINHYEEIFPAFAQTDIFKQYAEKDYHDQMVEEYRKNFFLLLDGLLPEQTENIQQDKQQDT